MTSMFTVPDRQSHSYEEIVRTDMDFVFAANRRLARPAAGDAR
ncbi:hypothetical protein [Luteimonas aquatica]|nr:hypothetical protein [Luteimonas aquatica]